MKFKIIYAEEGHPYQTGTPVSLRAEEWVDMIYPFGLWDENKPAASTACAVTDWIELSQDDLDALFLTGTKTIDATGCLCDVLNVDRNAGYLVGIEEEKAMAEAIAEEGI